MVINKKYSMYLKKIEKRTGKENILNNKYLIITRDGKKPPLGFFAFYITHLGWIDYALQHDMIPVVDMQYKWNVFLKEEEVGKVNSYEYYFKQPCGVSVDEALKDGNARYVWSNIPPYHPNDSLDYLYNPEIVQYYSKLAKKYMPFTDTVERELKEIEGALFPENSRILGVLARGTDYTTLKPFYHPVQPTMDMIITQIKKYRKEYDCDKIYVATEDQNHLNALKKEFGDDLIYMDQPRLGETTTYLNDDKEFTKRTPYQLGLDNLKSIYLLSRCKGLIAGRTSGTVGASILADQYEFMHIFSIGRYGVEDKIMEKGLDK